MTENDTNKKVSASGSATGRRPAQPNLLNFTLRGLAEWNEFPDEESRQKALSEIAEEAADLKSWGYWWAIFLHVVVVVGAMFVINLGLRLVSWPNIVEQVIRLGGAFAAFAGILTWLHRQGTAEQLREKLLAQGIPICKPCGYSLRGLSPTSERCPECGRRIEERVRSLLTDSPSDSAS